MGNGLISMVFQSESGGCEVNCIDAVDAAEDAYHQCKEAQDLTKKCFINALGESADCLECACKFTDKLDYVFVDGDIVDFIKKICSR